MNAEDNFKTRVGQIRAWLQETEKEMGAYWQLKAIAQALREEGKALEARGAYVHSDYLRLGWQALDHL